MKKNLVNIIKIDWLDKENPEAEVLFEINGIQLWAFCHPCYFKEGEVTEVYFSCIDDDISELAFWEENQEKKKDIVASKISRTSFYCYGQIKSINPVIIDCGTISISYGDWINDERTIGSYVYFIAARLDIEKD